MAGRIDFDDLREIALVTLPEILQRWLPDGRVERGEYVALNPTRADRHRGSFKINLRSGVWCDFATNEAGSDPIALVAYLDGISQAEAVRRIRAALGVTP